MRRSGCLWNAAFMRKRRICRAPGCSASMALFQMIGFVFASLPTRVVHSRKRIPGFVPLLVATHLLHSCPTHALANPAFEFRDGDRVVLLGDTFIEREQLYGYIEQRL